ncbi:MAG: DeoR family transcriptional regulator [Geminicoccaceae bacterium]
MEEMVAAFEVTPQTLRRDLQMLAERAAAAASRRPA